MTWGRWPPVLLSPEKVSVGHTVQIALLNPDRLTHGAEKQRG